MTAFVAMIGSGVVGKATGYALERRLGREVLYYDIHPRALQGLKHTTMDLEEAVRRCRVLFICVPTPTDNRGRGRFHIVESVARSIVAMARHLDVGPRIVVQKSTCVPGTADRIVASLAREGFREGRDFEYVVNPEFLDQADAAGDALQPNRIILGVGEGRQVPPELEALLSPFACPILVGTRREAELAKYAHNYAMALLISFWNELYLLSLRLGGIDTNWVADTFRHEPRLQSVPRVHGQAYGGACLPKDTRALLAHGRSAGAWMPLLRATVAINAHMARRFGVRSESWRELAQRSRILAAREPGGGAGSG